MRASTARGIATIVSGAILQIAALGAPLTLEWGGWRVEINPATLAATAQIGSGRQFHLSRAAVDGAIADDIRATKAEAHWRLRQQKMDVTASLTDEGFRMTFHATAPGAIAWPVWTEDAALDAIILPRGEGFYVPPREPRWRKFLLDSGGSDTMEELSLPMWGLRYPGATVTYIMENPFDNRLTWESRDASLACRLTHRFQRNQPGREHSVLVRIGGDSPVEAALLFRSWNAKHGRFVSYQDKIRALADAEKLLGAAHIYLWWVPPPFRRTPPNPELFLRRLHDAGLDRLWLGLGGEEIDYTRKHPEIAKRAREFGYLIAPYDSYNSIHSPSEKDTWSTAQFDQELYDKGAIVNEDGSKSRGFKGKGYHLSALAARPYVTRRVEAILKDAPFNSWFVDCDAFGELFDNYSPLYPHTKEQDMQARLERLDWLRDAKRLVVGSEGGQWYAAPAIHFAHGMTTPGFGWGDPELHDPRSPHFLGRYYPPDGPEIFLKPVDLPEDYLRTYFDPRYRLPLFQTAFHDSVITTERWDLPSLKFSNARQIVELLELLYGVPPLYHLNLAQCDSTIPAIQAHYAFFSPLHREIGTLPMTSFAWLTTDRSVQMTEFGGTVQVIANFRDGSVVVKRKGREPQIYSPHK